MVVSVWVLDPRDYVADWGLGPSVQHHKRSCTTYRQPGKRPRLAIPHIAVYHFCTIVKSKKTVSQAPTVLSGRMKPTPGSHWSPAPRKAPCAPLQPIKAPRWEMSTLHREKETFGGLSSPSSVVRNLRPREGHDLSQVTQQT